MNLEEEILRMYYDEYLTIWEIAGALRQSPFYIYTIIKKGPNYEEGNQSYRPYEIKQKS